MTRATIDELLAAARSSLLRLTPVQAWQAMGSGAMLIDIRAESQIVRDGAIAGALMIARNVLEWQLRAEAVMMMMRLVRTPSM